MSIRAPVVERKKQSGAETMLHDTITVFGAEDNDFVRDLLNTLIGGRLEQDAEGHERSRRRRMDSLTVGLFFTDGGELIAHLQCLAAERDRLPRSLNDVLVITDYEMPGANGAEVAKTAFELNVPCLVVTSNVTGYLGDVRGRLTPEQFEVAKRRVLDKPFGAKALRDAITPLLYECFNVPITPA
jgi:CheY-like chemotaxis protein